MNVSRNAPCPCGSGKKYKHCHGRAKEDRPSPEEATWRRLRAALDGFPTTMLRFVREVYGPEAVDEAWAEFTLWEDDHAEFDPDSPHLEVFIPWFFHRWAPDPADTGVEDVSLHDRSPTSVLLERRAWRLEPVLRRYLEACVEAPFSFHEIVRVEPGHGFRARDVITCQERDVIERSASRTLLPGDIFFGQLVTSDGLTVLEACAPHALSPQEKLGLVDLREHIAGEAGVPSPRVLDDWDIELREVYLEWMEALRNPPTPHLHNTDGEPIVFHRLTFAVPSAQEAFDALKHLALDETDDELLESAELEADGRVRRVSFSWKTAGKDTRQGRESVVLGHIEIEGDRLVANVNSEGRAARLRRIVTAACPDARETGADVETVEEAMAARAADADGEDAGDPDGPYLAQHPEVLDRIRAMTSEHYERWIHEEIPALGGQSPMAAIASPTGREKVQALIAQIERDGRRMVPPLDEAVTRMLRERLGLMG